MTRLVSLGEMMLRLAPPGFERLRRASSLDVRPCGAQFNIAANTAVLGMDSVFLTKLPDNELGHLAHALAASYGVDMSHVRREGDKVGIVFVEFSAAPRPLVHIYDRAGSAASTITEDDFDWGAILQGARYAYVDGIFPGLSGGCRRAALAFAGAAKEAGCTLCFDVNYRASLWPPAEALALYREMLPSVDILVTNRTVAEDIFGYGGSDGDLLRAYRADFGCEVVCLTYRHMQGLRRGAWSSTALFGDDVFTGREFAFDVVDRFGTGDAFFAGLLYAFDRDGDPQRALDFGDALCALAHTVEGDVAVLSPGEVDALLADDYSLITKR